ncbi:hypothetical protein LY90DRAFT_704453 [Neocallimastix californiae]|uniref:Arabinogalactan endo-beta-1,4-galactanase n=1 Tax=Neocallimastix californiae TaxID=1754190 RepID=A0A1Y2BUE9_9FUNG|nr:hypothetical protein LY90DRAFT_704453 [Neocallimastix californiae]|eukprot:ORY38267.1 hypothetical protein LY90DRAFT_704453 [Neocallimastix californiae]
MKILFFLIFIINAVIITTTLASPNNDNSNDDIWLNISHWNQTDVDRLQKRGNYDSQIKPLSFYKGVDISSIISLENSGVQFYDTNGQPQDIFKTLASVGVNCIRVRIWNSPRSTDGKTYGGGNNDLEVAREIGSRAAKAGLPLFVDFHYSDFWADPAKQSIPKEWKGCLEWLLENGSYISMVQIGNETTCFMCGENEMVNVMKMMSNGIQAVRDINKNILIALHFTNPNKTDNMLWYASQLAEAKVDYDVFCTSYYPFWHGTTENLQWILGEIANKYGKKVMVAEFSYPYTEVAKTSDNCEYSHVNHKLEGTEFNYPLTLDGQIQCIKDVYSHIKNTKNGIGAFYWEPAWIAPKASNDLERRQLWEKYGSSWATKTAAEYDINADSSLTGESAWDNQAVFDQEGKPLKSIWALGDGEAPSNYATNNNNNNNNNNNCFSINLGYPCCNGNTVYYTDNDGQWGYENNNWCGIKESKQNALEDWTGKNQGYSYCNLCDVIYNDNDGRWGIENGEWCGIKSTC